jgi:hypothetical protein
MRDFLIPLLACFGFSLVSSGNSFAAPPPNDSFTTPAILSATLPATATGTNVEATVEPGEPEHDGSARFASVWWRWVPATSGPVVATTLGSAIDTSLAVFAEGPAATFVPVGAAEGYVEYLSPAAVTFTATAGSTYYLAIASPNAESPRGALALAIVGSTTPANDAFAQATLIVPPIPAVVFAPNVGLTLELNEPPYGDGSAWWKWVAPQTGTYHLAGNHSVAAFTGPDVENLTQLFERYSTDYVFSATAGETIYLQAATYYPSPLVFLQLRADAPPANDDFAGATLLPIPLPQGIAANLSDATSELNELFYSDLQYYEPKSAWWRFTASTNGTVELATESNFWESELAALTGPDLTHLDPWSVSVNRGFLAFPVQAGVTYHLRIAVPSYIGGQLLGTLRTGPPAPVNDASSAPIVLSGIPAAVGGTIAGATAEADENAEAAGTVWYRWTAPLTARVALAIDPDSDTTAVFDFGTGETPSEFLPLIAGGSDTQVDVAAGTTYTIRVRGRYFAGDAGGFVFSILPRPVNDDFAAAQLLSGSGGIEVTGTNIGAAAEADEPDSVGDPLSHSIWWKWVAPSSGPWTFAAARRKGDSQRDGRVTVFTGSTLSTLSAASIGEGTTPASLIATAGVTYHIRFESAAVGAIILAVNPPPANDAYTAPLNLAGPAPISASGTVLGATPDASTDGDSGQSVWFSWTATWAGPTHLKATNWQSGERFGFQVFTGPFPDLQQVDSTRDGVSNFTAALGENYRIRVDRRDRRIFAPGTFTLTLVPVAPNDHFANATELVGTGALTATGWNLGATREAGEPRGIVRYSPKKPYGSVWWKWTAPASQLVTIDTFGSPADTVLHVFTGPALNALILHRVSDDARVEKDSRVAFVAQAGVTYSIRVAGARTQDGAPITLHLTTSGVPSDTASHLAYGRSYLEGRTAADLVAADQHFAQALALSPSDLGANALRAVTRLARLQQDAAITNLLSQWGVVAVRSTLHRPEYETIRDGLGNRSAPPGANVAQASQLLAVEGLNTLTACEAHLAQVTAPSFALPLSDSETGRRWATVDLGDIRMLRALASALRAAVHLNNTVNSDGSVNELLQLENQRKLRAEHVLKLLPNLLKSRTSDERALFKSAAQQANALYQSASSFIRARADTADNPHHLFTVGAGRTGKEETLRENAAGFSQALDGPALWAGRLVNLTPLMATSTPFRDFLPKFKESLVVQSTTPDPALQGSLTPGTQGQVNELLKNNDLLFMLLTFADWASVFLGEQSPANQAPDADVDFDGVSNFGEFIFALDPLRASAAEEYTAQGLIPGATPGAKHFAITFIRRKAPAPVLYKVWVSDNLNTWDTTEAQVEQVGVPVPMDDDVSEQVTYRLKLSVSAAGRKYLKVVGTAF